MTQLLIAKSEKYITYDFTCTVLDIFHTFGSNVAGCMLVPICWSTTCVSWPSSTDGGIPRTTGEMFIVGKIWNDAWKALIPATVLELIDKVAEAFGRLLEIVDNLEELLDLNLDNFGELSDAFVTPLVKQGTKISWLKDGAY